MIRVFIADDHEVVRRGISELLDGQPDMTVVGEAATCREALGRISATTPDVAILDVHLPDGSGIDVCRHIRQELPTVHCLILTAYDDDEAVFAALLADASGYLLKAVRGDELTQTVRAVAAGRRLLHPAAAREATQLMRATPDEDPRFGSLGIRERQILALIADGLTNRQIGERMNLAEKTIKNYVSSLLSKLGFEHRTQAAVFEIERARQPGASHRGM